MSQFEALWGLCKQLYNTQSTLLTNTDNIGEAHFTTCQEPQSFEALGGEAFLC